MKNSDRLMVLSLIIVMILMGSVMGKNSIAADAADFYSKKELPAKIGGISLLYHYIINSMGEYFSSKDLFSQEDIQRTFDQSISDVESFLQIRFGNGISRPQLVIRSHAGECDQEEKNWGNCQRDYGVYFNNSNKIVIFIYNGKYLKFLLNLSDDDFLMSLKSVLSHELVHAYQYLSGLEDRAIDQGVCDSPLSCTLFKEGHATLVQEELAKRDGERMVRIFKLGQRALITFHSHDIDLKKYFYSPLYLKHVADGAQKKGLVASLQDFLKDPTPFLIDPSEGYSQQMSSR